MGSQVHLKTHTVPPLLKWLSGLQNTLFLFGVLRCKLADELVQLRVGEWRGVGELDEFPIYFEGMIELQAIECNLFFFVVVLKEGICKFALEVLYILSALLPSLVLGLLKVLAVNVRFHALRKLAVHADRESSLS